MQLPLFQTVQCDAAPDKILPWLRRLVDALHSAVMPDAPPQVFTLGPATMSRRAPVLFETVAIYLCTADGHTTDLPPLAPDLTADAADDQTVAQAGEQVALALTRLPPRQCSICLEIGHWLPQLVTPDFVLKHFTHHLPKPVSTSNSGVTSSSTHSRQQTTSHPSATPSAIGGGPRLACNRWLADQLAHTHLPHVQRSFYPAWLEQYRALRGDYPADPRRSFRAAVAAIRRHQAKP